MALNFQRRRIEEFCQKHGIRKLELFGSAATGDLGPDSDIDVMVEFAPGRTAGLGFFTMAEELSAILGRNVDLLTRRSIEQSENYIFRRSALTHVVTLYEAA